MAAFQERNGSYRVIFNYRGKQRAFTLGRVGEAEARAKAAQVNYLLMRLKQGLIEMPPGANVVAFFMHDGAPSEVPILAGPATETTLADLRDRYLDTHANDTLEVHTLRRIRRHFGHFTRLLGERLSIRKLTLADLQGYVESRAKAKGRRGTLLPATIKKEIVTLRTAWNWASRMGIVEGRCPADGLRYAKSDEKPPFQCIRPAKLSITHNSRWSAQRPRAKVTPWRTHVRGRRFSPGPPPWTPGWIANWATAAFPTGG